MLSLKSSRSVTPLRFASVSFIETFTALASTLCDICIHYDVATHNTLRGMQGQACWMYAFTSMS